eukprot:CAMPEP_0175171968 /NCGR_PEP_ID=MMETSP0087-20121206/31147_1 /TAXON_ID=136419 /ORGANISM="Unknown Unknown, Strain D1" /LENGTH=139 /DNA_ID=CAMNT_0016462937 /DNA_START=150 /DNA_END=569 /DNA_ORIENTATION=-
MQSAGQAESVDIESIHRIVALIRNIAVGLGLAYALLWLPAIVIGTVYYLQKNPDKVMPQVANMLPSLQGFASLILYCTFRVKAHSRIPAVSATSRNLQSEASVSLIADNTAIDIDIEHEEKALDKYERFGSLTDFTFRD